MKFSTGRENYNIITIVYPHLLAKNCPYACTVKPVLSGPLLSGHLSKSRKSLPLFTVNVTSIKRSALLGGRGHPF